MKTIDFFPWSKPSSILGYGTTSFMAAGTTRERLELLERAYDAGIIHYDTAAYYGHGEAERLLGMFLAGKRDQVTVTTKFGIEPSGVVKSRWVNLLARRVLKTAPFLRKLVGRSRATAATTGNFEPDKATLSLERSLKALNTDHIDLFLLHEPGPEDAMSGPLADFLQREVERGRIRAFGCGGVGNVMERIAQTGASTSHWLQFEDNVIERSIEAIHETGAKCITFAPFNAALEILQAHLAAKPGVCADWSRQLDLDCSDADILSGLLQASSHYRNPDGILLFSTSRKERIARAAEIAGGACFGTDQIDLLQKLTAPLARS